MITHVDEPVYLPALVSGFADGVAGCVLAHHHFTGCTIYGPAVLRVIDWAALGPTCSLLGKPEDLVLRDDRANQLGLIGLVGCQFEFCRFEGIAFSVRSEEMDVVLRGLNEWVT